MKKEDKEPLCIIPELIEDLGTLYAKETSKYKYRFGLYKCPYCNKEFKARTSHIMAGKIKSCGCLRGENHGLSYHRLYSTWNGMKDRCINPDNPMYILYGGRGIQVCNRWLSLSNFIEDMYPSFREGLTLDRINPNGDYEPDNCRWASQSTQCRNTGVIPSHNTSGIVGVYYNKDCNKWIANICINNKTKYIGSFEYKEDAVLARDTYIIENNLEHTLSIGKIKRK